MLDGRIYIGAGWGERTQWYQNILADPQVTVQARGPAFGAVARLITDDEELRRLYWQARQTSPLWQWKRSLGSWDIRDEAEDFVAKKGRIPFLRLDPLSECPLPPLRADLVWVWPALAIAVVGGVRAVAVSPSSGMHHWITCSPGLRSLSPCSPLATTRPLAHPIEHG